MTSVYSLSQEQAKEAVKVAIKADTPVLLTGSAGQGKSAIMQQVADELGLELIDIRLSQVSKYDLLGYPIAKDGIMHYAPLSCFPLENTPIPENKQGWLIFLNH